MKRIGALSLLVILCMAVTGCAAAPQTPMPHNESVVSALPSVEENAQNVVSTKPTVTPEAAPAQSDADPFFFHPPDGEPGEVEIRIYKDRRVLELRMDGEAAGRFPIGLGFAPEGDKEQEGDGRTPVGAYYVCSRNDRSNYYLSLGVSYPNTEDARQALESGLIDQQTYERIADAEERRALPDWDTPLGGEICIHSGGSSSDWTWGCIATGDETMDILWEYCPHGTPILIYE